MGDNTDSTNSKLVRIVLAIATIATAVSTVLDKCGTITTSPMICADQNCQDARAYTLAAWKEMQIIDQETHARFNGIMSDGYFKSLIASYEQIQTEKVDPIFVTHLYNSMDVFKTGLALYQEMNQTKNQVFQQYTDQGQGQQAWEQTYNSTYKQREDQIWIDYNRLDAQDKDIGRTLAQKYSIPFPDGVTH